MLQADAMPEGHRVFVCALVGDVEPRVTAAGRLDPKLLRGVDRAEAKRRSLMAAQPEAKQRARVLALLPKAAAMYLKQLEAGLAGDPRGVLRARHILRDYLGPITLTPGKAGELWASYRLNAGALVKEAGTGGLGEAICAVPAVPIRVRVKAGKR